MFFSSFHGLFLMEELSSPFSLEIKSFIMSLFFFFLVWSEAKSSGVHEDRRGNAGGFRNKKKVRKRQLLQ